MGHVSAITVILPPPIQHDQIRYKVTKKNALLQIFRKKYRILFDKIEI